MKASPFLLNTLDKPGRRLERIVLEASDPRDESWLQQLLYKHPELLPIDVPRDSFFWPPIPLGREVSTGRGPMDVLFVSPAGGITIVETKLWKNPEKHRTVVAQIIDYAKELVTWDYDQLCEAIRTSAQRRGETEKISLEEKVAEGLKTDGVRLHDFQEAVSANLSDGSFLLMIVGDRVSPNIALLSKAIQGAPGLNFNLRLAELQLYQVGAGPDGPLLVVPEVLGRTVEKKRAVVRIQYEKKPDVSVEAVDETLTETVSEKIDEDLLFKVLPKRLHATARQGIADWESIRGLTRIPQKTLRFEMLLDGHYQLFVSWDPLRSRVSIVRQKDFDEWLNGDELRQKYQDAIDASPVLAAAFRNNKMFVKFESLSSGDLQILLSAARELATLIRSQS